MHCFSCSYLRIMNLVFASRSIEYIAAIHITMKTSLLWEKYLLELRDFKDIASI